jgi:hypothetical protein
VNLPLYLSLPVRATPSHIARCLITEAIPNVWYSYKYMELLVGVGEVPCILFLDGVSIHVCLVFRRSAAEVHSLITMNKLPSDFPHSAVMLFNNAVLILTL